MTLARFAAAAALLAGLVACEDKVVTNTGAPTTPPPPTRGAASDAGAPAATLKIEYTENDFAESDRSRDPFRNYASSFVGEGTKKQTANQRQVMLSQYSVDELKLVAIVGGGDYPRAMLVDPQGKGWVLRRGDYLGRPEVVHVGGPGGGDYQLNWRVDKVRDGDLVLLREDPAQPSVPPATRVILLHPEGDPKDKL